MRTHTHAHLHVQRRCARASNRRRQHAVQQQGTRSSAMHPINHSRHRCSAQPCKMKNGWNKLACKHHCKHASAEVNDAEYRDNSQLEEQSAAKCCRARNRSQHTIRPKLTLVSDFAAQAARACSVVEEVQRQYAACGLVME